MVVTQIDRTGFESLEKLQSFRINGVLLETWQPIIADFIGPGIRMEQRFPPGSTHIRRCLM